MDELQKHFIYELIYEYIRSRFGQLHFIILFSRCLSVFPSVRDILVFL